MFVDTMTLDQPNDSHAVCDNYISLDEYRVHFPREVEAFFSERIGSEEFDQICKLACQAPPYTI